MGKLYQLEISNFKSYAGHQIIGPFYDFTCIIGPNGSGKSNLMDAISFVLGVQSRHLRCTNLKELIYRKNAKATPARNSTVQLTYQVSAEEVPGVKEGEMIYFSRTINPSGTSTYRYNDSEVTYDQYEEILQNIGVLVKVRNFLVFQGDVESIASKSPMELTKLLEHICGSDIYATEYEQLRKKKEEADESAIFAISKKKMFLSQLREVKLQKDEAELFQTKQKELQDYKTNQILWQLYQSQDIIIQHQTNITEHQDEMKEYDQELTNIQKNLNKLKLDANQSNTLYNKSDKSIQQTKQEKEKLESKLLPLHNKIILLKKRINENQGNEKKLKEKLNQKDSLLKTLKQQMNEMEKQLNDLKTSLNEGSGSSGGGNGGSGGGALKLTEEQRHTYSALKEKATSISSSQKLQLSSMEMEYKSLQQQYTLHQNQFDAITKESNMITNTLNDYQQRREQLINNIKSYDEELHRIQYDNKGLSESIEHALHKSQELKHQLKGIDEKLLLLGDQRRKTKQEQEINAGIESMQSLFKGVYGKLSDLFRPIQQKYSKALTVAGGKLMDAIVVENKYIAQECIRYVKENRIGVFTFLPLDTIQVPNFPDRLRRIDPVHYHPCIDLIEVYEERFRPAVLYALETTLIADNLDYARQLSFDKGENVKIVTLKGQIISRSGAMTGGSLKQQITDRWEEKEYDNLKLKKRQLEEELQIYETTLEKRRLLHEFQERQRQYDARKEFCVKEIKVLEERIHSMQLQLTDKQKQIARYQKEIESYQREINKMKQSITTLQQQIIDSEKDLFLEFSASIGVENILVYEQQMEEQQQLLQDEFVRLSKQYSSLKAQYDYERKQNISIELKQLQTEITQHQNQLEKMNNEEETIQKQLKQINDKLNDLLLQYQQYSKEKNDIHDKLMKEKKDMMDINQKRENLLKKITSDEIIIERNRAELLQIIKQTIQFNEVTLPLVNKISDKDKSDWILDFSALIEIEPSLPTQLEGKYLNLMAFSNQYPDVDTSKLSNVDKEIQQKITALVNELETMKPNLHAAEKFDDVMTKVHESSNELENCKDLVNQYALQFEEVRSQRLQLFNDCFDHINQTLSDIYRDLTKSSKHPLGGKAYFTLENREEPFLEGIRYTAMPPMKRFRDMEQLSGGEKTMAALALLFSIHSYRQAPFFVLDEVDAALDNVNVKKICSYMKQRSKEFQCVVISLKDIFFEHAEALIGVYRADDQEMACSKTLTLLLKNYPESFQEDEDEEEKEEELEGIAA